MIELNFPNAVRHERDFFGRREERGRIENALLSESSRLAFVTGERRVGKTSFQNVTTEVVIGRKTDRRTIPMYIPSPPAIRSFQDYVHELLIGLSNLLGRSRRQIGLYDEHGRFSANSVGEAVDAIRKVLDGLVDLNIIVVIDEFDDHIRNCHIAHERENILGFHKYLVEKRPTEPAASILLYPSLTRLPEEDEALYGSLLLSKGEVVALTPFSLADTEEMVVGLLRPNAGMTTEAMELFYELSGGHPYVAKLLLTHALPGYPHPASHVQITRNMIEDAIGAAVVDLHPRNDLGDIWKRHLDQEEKRVMLLLAMREGGLTQAEALLLSPEQRRAAKVLVRRGYLNRDVEDAWSLRIGFWRFWLREWEDFEIERKRLHLDQLIGSLTHHPDESRPIIVVDQRKSSVYLRDRPIHVAPQEFRFFVCCARRSGLLVSYDQLIDEIWKDDRREGVSLDAVYMLIRRIRRRLADDADCLETRIDFGVILYRALLIA